MDELTLQLNDLIGGLVNRMDQPPTQALQDAYIGNTGIGTAENATVPTHCLRTVSQRSLSDPVTFLSEILHEPAGADVFARLVTDPVLGALPGVGLGGTAPIVFNNANDPIQRQRINDLVLIGIRAKVSAMAQAGNGGPGSPFNYGRYVKSLENFVKNFVVLRVYHTSDTSDPWIDDTPLRYFDRPSSDFLPVPPVMWKDRDPKMELDVRTADFGGAKGKLPSLEVTDNVLDLQLSIIIESLWIPNPKACGNFWPGSLCPASHVKNLPGYVGK